MEQQASTFERIDSLDDLARADCIAVSISGGVDSRAILAIVAEQAKRAGVSDRVVCVHADLLECEHPGTLALCEAQAQAFGFPLLVTRRNVATRCRLGTCEHPGPPDTGSLLSQMAHKGRSPRIGATGCQGTTDHKRGPIWRVYTAISTEWRQRTGETRPMRLLEVIGLAAHEGNARKCLLQGGGKRNHPVMARCPLGGRMRTKRTSDGKLDKPSSFERRHVLTWYPIADASKAEVWDLVERSIAAGYPGLLTLADGSGIYDRLPRHSCAICVFSSRDAVNVAAQLYPDLFAKFLQTERDHFGDEGWSQEFKLADVAADIAAGRTVERATTWGDQE